MEGAHDENPETQVILVRHAQSDFNATNIHLASLKKPQSAFDDNASDRAMIDCSLSKVGHEQTEIAKDRFKDLQVHTVLVSPLTRTLTTAYQLFKSHPDFEQINFVVYPELREYFKATCDIQWNTAEVIDQFTELIPQLDSSQLRDEIGEIKSLMHLIAESCEDIQPEKDLQVLSGEELTDYMVERVKFNYPKSTEHLEELEKRVTKMKSIIKSHLDQIPTIEGEEPKKLVVVAHCSVLTEHLGLGHGDGKAKINNCEPFYDQTNYSEY